MHDEPSSSVLDNDFVQTDIWVSSLDLDEEESEWDRDGYDTLDPDFPSPSYRIRILQNLQIKTSKLRSHPSFKRLFDVRASLGSPSSIIDLSSKRALSVSSPQKVLDADEPLFWPFDRKSYWRPEFEGNYLGISPRAGVFRIKRARGRHAPKSAGVGKHDKNGPSQQKENVRQEYRGRLLINAKLAQSALADHKKTRALKSQVSHASKVPSRLSRSTTAHDPLKKGRKNNHHQSNSVKKKRGRAEKSSLVQYLLEFEAGEFQIYLGGEVPIEALMGLDEFDGHEGVGKLMRAS